MGSVVVLVHGTFARGSRWPELCNCVERCLPRPVRIFYFLWSGKNGTQDRHDAAMRLEQRLRELSSRYPLSPLYVIAHSHGGNVALLALRDEELQRLIRMVICLSTPFINVMPRRLARVAIGQVIFGISIWCFLIFQLLMPTGVAFVVAAICLIVQAALIPFVEHLALATMKKSFLPAMVRTDIKILRSPYDEAALTLAFFQAVSWISYRLWRLIRRASEDLLTQTSLGEEIDVEEVKTPRIRWLGLYNLFDGLSVIVDCAMAILNAATDLVPKSISWRSIAVVLVLSIFSGGVASVVPAVMAAPVVLPVFVIFAVVLVAGWHSLAAAIVAPLLPLVGVPLLVFGPEIAVASPFLEFSVEATPPGTWTLYQLDATALGSADHQFHSVTYSHPSALVQVEKWLSETVDPVAQGSLAAPQSRFRMALD